MTTSFPLSWPKGVPRSRSRERSKFNVTLHMVRATFTGFKSLPPPPDKKPWWNVLGVGPTASKEAIETAYREKARAAHPDAGGTHEAIATALQWLSLATLAKPA